MHQKNVSAVDALIAQARLRAGWITIQEAALLLGIEPVEVRLAIETAALLLVVTPLGPLLSQRDVLDYKQRSQKQPDQKGET